MAPPSNTTVSTPAAQGASGQRRVYRDVRDRAERQRRQREQVIERLVEQQRERRLPCFRRPSR